MSLCLVIVLQSPWCPLLQSGRLHGLHTVLRAESAVVAYPLLSRDPGRLAMSWTICTHKASSLILCQSLLHACQEPDVQEIVLPTVWRRFYNSINMGNESCNANS